MIGDEKVVVEGMEKVGGKEEASMEGKSCKSADSNRGVGWEWSSVALLKEEVDFVGWEELLWKRHSFEEIFTLSRRRLNTASFKEPSGHPGL